MGAEEIFGQALKTGNQVIEVIGDGVQYIAEGLPGADPEAAAFRCYAVFALEGGGRHVRHADGYHAPGWGGVNLPGLVYLPVEGGGE